MHEKHRFQEIDPHTGLIKRGRMQAMARGACNQCPQCGAKPLFHKFLKPTPSCPSCNLDISGHRADDLPPYITIMIAGHVIVWGILVVEKAWSPALWVHLGLWLPLTIVLCLWLMQPVKGAVIGLQWALRLHGFENQPDMLSSARPQSGNSA